MTEPKELNEYQAALLTGLSPTLLRWLVGHAPKSGSNRKLPVSRKDGEALFFDRDELTAFNDWLKSPWPRKEGARPPIPSGIRAEIKAEANGACAMCQAHAQSCEAAHLDPVSKSNNNHPENLLWLCANHHTEYDKGLFGPTAENAEFVVEFKRVLHRFKRILWTMQDQISAKLFAVLDTCALLSKQLESAKTPAQVEAVERLGKEALQHLPNLAPVSKSDPKFAAFEKIKVGVSFIADAKQSALPARLKRAVSIREDVIVAFGYVSCPLCKGAGRHAGMDCPVCAGDGEITEDVATRFDPAEFEEVDCPVCNGSGAFRGSDCPACGGDARIERRFAEQIDRDDFRDVDCPVCKGEGTARGEPCPACNGEAQIERRYADRIDTNDFRHVDCPICDGNGTLRGEICPGCGGDARMERRHADQIDVRDYKLVECPLCKGKGRFRGDDCPACNGDARMERRHADQIDLRDYELVNCPLCKGKGRFKCDNCPACDGDGRMERRHADRVDPREYED